MNVPQTSNLLRAPHLGPISKEFGQPIETEKRISKKNVAKRQRQHLNPLAARWQGPIEISDNWYSETFSDNTLPLTLDIGCGKGRYVEKVAKKHPDWNALGLEIRQPLVTVANERNVAQGNCAFLACNANVSLEYLIDNIIPEGVLKVITVQFSDPWFKKKHAKRRILQTKLLHTIYKSLLANDGKLFIQTDVHNLARQMDLLCKAHHGLRRDSSLKWLSVHGEDVDQPEEEWLAESPRGVPTEREICVMNAGKPVYRMQYEAVAFDAETMGIWDENILKMAEGVSLKEDSIFGDCNNIISENEEEN